MPTVATVRLVPNAQPGFPEFSDAYVLSKLEDALREYADMTAAKDYERIVNLAVAFELATEAAETGQGNMALGPVTSASAGGVSMSIAVEAIKAYSLAANTYGRALKRLLRINGPYTRVGVTPGWYR